MLKAWMQFLYPGHRKNPRALRIPLETPLRFRRMSENSWSHGIAANISCSGVLLRSDQNIDVQTAIQMMYMLPVTSEATSGLSVFCKGEVVRAATPPSGRGKFHCGVKILDYYPGTRWIPDLRRIVP